MTGVVYVVGGTAGDYDERSQWIVGACDTQADATAHVARLQAVADAYNNACTEHGFNYPHWKDVQNITDVESAAIDRWTKKSDRLLKRAKKDTGDQNLERDTKYYSEEVKFFASIK